MVHKTTKVQYGNQEADIDVKLAPLIAEVWKAGIVTMQCCQHHPKWITGQRNYAWIQFGSMGDLEEFIEVIGRQRDENRDLYDRVIYHWAKAKDPVPGLWLYGIHPMDWSLADKLGPNGEWVYEDEPAIVVPADVYFPQRDIQRITALFVAYNDARETTLPICSNGVPRPIPASSTM